MTEKETELPTSTASVSNGTPPRHAVCPSARPLSVPDDCLCAFLGESETLGTLFFFSLSYGASFLCVCVFGFVCLFNPLLVYGIIIWLFHLPSALSSLLDRLTWITCKSCLTWLHSTEMTNDIVCCNRKCAMQNWQPVLLITSLMIAIWSMASLLLELIKRQ